VDVVFSHMQLQYLLAAFPACALFRKPAVQWYAYGHRSPELYIVHALAKRIVTSTRDSYPLPANRKVTILSQGVDFDQFALPPEPYHGPATVISVGRIEPSKGVHTLIEVAANLINRPGLEKVVFRWVGMEVRYAPPDYRQQLEELVARYGLENRFIFAGPASYREMPALYHASSVMVSLSETYSLDKVVLEALACGLPAIATADVYRQVLQEYAGMLMAPERDVAAISDRLEHLLRMTPEERFAVAGVLRKRVVSQHGLANLMRRLAGVLAEVSHKDHPVHSPSAGALNE
jgi:glycosyltransferase involved in cell wall biosynthesis